MKIVNMNTKQVLATNAKFATSISDQIFGLLNKNNPRALVFRTRFGIHTFGLQQPIDVLVLDQNNKVVKIKQSLKPNKIFLWNPKYNIVVELPANKTLKTAIGNKLKWID